MNPEAEMKIRNLIREKIRFTDNTRDCQIKRFNPQKAKHQNKIIDRLVRLANEVYGGSGPSPASHRLLTCSWSVVYKTKNGNSAAKDYSSPIEALSPFGSSSIVEVEIVYAGSD